ncbi:hypothetical protein J6W34_01335, partial [bacterium]|nr:hypothetical protein [bacterium]
MKKRFESAGFREKTIIYCKQKICIKRRYYKQGNTNRTKNKFIYLIVNDFYILLVSFNLTFLEFLH